MNNQKTWQDFWGLVGNGEHGDVEELIWQKSNGQWIMLIGDPAITGCTFAVGGIHYNPWTGEKLPTTISPPTA